MQFEDLKQWLTDPSSFMHRLTRCGVENAEIRVLREEWLKPEPWESDFLKLDQELALIREVSIASDSVEWMMARTVFSPEIIKAKQGLSQLGNRSLGSLLFHDPDIKRGELEFLYTSPHELWKNNINEMFWTRRSIFTLHQHALLLTEMFMPALTNLCLKN